jgi:hypothetical protein
VQRREAATPFGALGALGLFTGIPSIQFTSVGLFSESAFQSRGSWEESRWPISTT